MKRYVYIQCLLVFLIVWTLVIVLRFDYIFKKTLYFQDESSNLTVAANITRQFFPPMLRVNSLVTTIATSTPFDTTQGSWMENPYWQHIPPLFTYIPLPFFLLDKQITIEMARLAYAFIVLLTGILFISIIYRFERSITGMVSATIASSAMMFSLITQAVITGWIFGRSDIVLAFFTIACFGTICWYLDKPTRDRQAYSLKKVAFMGLIMALPVITKSVIGLIPPATFFGLLLFDHQTINKKVLTSIGCFIALVVIYYGMLYISSPATFVIEIMTPFRHFSNYENWGGPWHYYVSHYFPLVYIQKYTSLFWITFGAGLALLTLPWFEKRNRHILILSSTWFLGTIIALSCVTSKVPNLMFQTFLLGLFFVWYISLYSLRKLFRIIYQPLPSIPHWMTVISTGILTIIAIIMVVGFFKVFAIERNTPYTYVSDKEQFYQVGEYEQKMGANPSDIFILDTSKDNYWFRYYILFLTGAEARTQAEINYYKPTPDIVIKKYKQLFIIKDRTAPAPFPSAHLNSRIEFIGSFAIYEYDPHELSNTPLYKQ